MNARFDENDGDVQALTKRERRNGRNGIERKRERFLLVVPSSSSAKKHPKTARSRDDGDDAREEAF